jgi:outer membrane protein TolC
MNLRLPTLWITALTLTASPFAWSAQVIGAPKKALSVGGASKPKYSGPAPLSLKQAVEIFLKQNLTFQGTLLNQEIARITYRQQWRSFYLPNLKFTTSFTSAQTLATLPGTPARLAYPTNRLNGFPSTATIGLTATSPNLFNFFLDRLAFDQQVMDFERAQQRLDEEKRTQAKSVYEQYIAARLAQEQFEAAERSLQISEVILNLVRSRKALGTADQTEVESAEVDRNDARKKVIEERTNLKQALFSLNQTLNVKSDSDWNLTTSFDYKPLDMTFEQAFDIFKERSPTMRDQKLTMEKQHMDLESFEKQRMGLPSLTMNLSTVRYENTWASSSTNPVSSGDRIDATLSFNLTIPILDGDGFFRMDASRIKRIGLEKAEIDFRAATIQGERDIRTAFSELQKLQEQLAPLRESFDASAKVLDRMVGDMATKKPSRLELRDAIKNAREKELELLKNVMEFIKSRNNFYVQIGKDLEF